MLTISIPQILPAGWAQADHVEDNRQLFYYNDIAQSYCLIATFQGDFFSFIEQIEKSHWKTVREFDLTSR